MLKDKEQKILSIIQSSGPKLPTEVSKAIGTDTYITSAILSTLVKDKHLQNSSRKIGSSLVYYISGQEAIVRNRLLDELNESEKKTLDAIKSLRIAFETDLYPQERFLLSDLKDFAIPVKIRTDSGQELNCWKYYDVSDEEFKNIVNQKLMPKEEPEEPEPPPIPEFSKPEVIILPVEKTKSVKQEKIIPEKKITIPSSAFMDKIKKYLLGIDAEIINTLRAKPNELVTFIKVPTIIGGQSFMLFAFNKKSVTEADLSKIYVESSKERKPILLLVPNELGAKSKKYVEKHFGDILKVIKI